jgi:hypothetical protein
MLRSDWRASHHVQTRALIKQRAALRDVMKVESGCAAVNPLINTCVCGRCGAGGGRMLRSDWRASHHVQTRALIKQRAALRDVMKVESGCAAVNPLINTCGCGRCGCRRMRRNAHAAQSPVADGPSGVREVWARRCELYLSEIRLAHLKLRRDEARDQHDRELGAEPELVRSSDWQQDAFEDDERAVERQALHIVCEGSRSLPACSSARSSQVSPWEVGAGHGIGTVSQFSRFARKREAEL